TAGAGSGRTVGVVVSNSVGTGTSKTATLTVNVGPAITTQPVSQTVTAGATATFSVVASGTAPLRYQWQKNGANISGATSARYTTQAPSGAESGSTCAGGVENEGGRARARLAVNVGPAITTPPVSQTVTAPATATFSVVASGTAPLSYQCQKNGSNISGATSASYTTPATTTADSGSTFRVVVSN